jgi:TOMM system kinase/cyclase fusion protein
VRTQRLHPIAICPVFAERYELIEPLGRGGFASVFRAVQRSTGQSVAVKILERASEPGGGLDPVHVERFRRETRLCASLHHPHLVRLVDGGEEEGWLYTVFEFVPGRSLEQVLEEEGALPAEDALHMMAQVLDAVGYAHRQGVIHRDLTPANVMVPDAGLRRNALVLDFGIGAFSERARSEEIARLTATNEAIGTPSYAAPEQLRGEPPSVRSDLYSWGLVLLECLSGEKPVRGNSIQEQLAQQLGPDPVEVPEAVRAMPVYRVLARALSKSPEERPASAEELMALLRLASAPLTAGVPASGGSETPAPLRPVTVLSVRGTWPPPAGGVPEGQHRIRALQRVVDEAVRAHGGRCIAALGSRVVGLFGGSEPMEQAARAALEAAARARDAMAAEADAAVLFAGVRSGEMAAPEGDVPAPFEAAASAVVDEAVALEARAGANEIWACHETQLRLRDRAALEPVPGIGHGATEAPLFRLARAAADLRSAPSTASTLIGRRSELARLEATARTAWAGRPQSVLVAGEAGIGKSRLVHELKRRLDTIRWIACRCTPESAHSPLRPVVEWLAGQTKETPLETLLEELHLDVHALHPLLAELTGAPLHPAHPAPALSPRLKRERVMDATIELILAEARREPLVFWMEDLHWADPTTRELLLDLVRRVRSAETFEPEIELPLFIVLTARSTFEPPWSLSDVSLIQLLSLSRSDSEELVRTLLRGGARCDEGLIASLVDRAGGVPLFLEEMARVARDSERQRSDRASRPAPLPATLQDLLDARIQRLRSSTRRTAQQAACVGREFDFPLLVAIAGREEEALRDDLADLRREGIVYRRSDAGADRYAFHHALLSDAARDSMQPEERCSTHLQIAMSLLGDPSEQTAERHPERLAHHFEEARAFERAIEFWNRAAFAAFGRSAHAEAIHHYERGLELLLALPETPERDHAERTMRIAVGNAYVISRGSASEPVEQHFERALELCNRYAEAPRLFSALNGLWAYHMNRGNVEQTASLVARMREFAERSGSERRLLFAHHAAGTTAFWAGRLEEALPDLVQATELLDKTIAETAPGPVWYRNATTAPMFLGWCLHLMGRPDEGLAWRTRGLEIAETLDNADARVEIMTYAVALHHDRREPDEALALSDVVVPLAEETGLDFWLGIGMAARGWARCHAGDVNGGLEEIDAGTASFRRSGANVPLVYRAYYLAETHLLTGRFDEGIAALDDALARSRGRLDRFYDAETCRLRGELQARRARLEAADEDFHRALALARVQGARLFELRAAASLARLHRGTARAQEGRRALEVVYRRFEGGSDLPDLVEARDILEGGERAVGG